MGVEINVANGSGRKWIDEQHYVDMSSYATKMHVRIDDKLTKEAGANG